MRSRNSPVYVLGDTPGETDEIHLDGRVYRQNTLLGRGRSCDNVVSFCNDNITSQVLAVKNEKRDSKTNQYLSGEDLLNEVYWWDKIYGKNTAAIIGNPKNTLIQHKLVMPEISGDTLTNIRYTDLKHLILHFIAAAIAVKKLHDCGGVHRDITANNLIGNTNKKDNTVSVALIDFEVTEKVGKKVPVHHPHPEHLEKTVERDAPETYSVTEKETYIKVSTAEDCFRFGYLIQDMYHNLINMKKLFSVSFPDKNNIDYITLSLKAKNPQSRWPMERVISVFHTLFIATKPETPLSVTSHIRNKLTACCSVLLNEIREKDNALKQEKKDGLTFILRAMVMMPLPEAIKAAQKSFPRLTSGTPFFGSQRTKLLLDELLLEDKKSPTSEPMVIY